MKVSLELLKEKIICEYTELCDSISYSIENEEFSLEPLQINLAISLHAPNDIIRNKIMYHESAKDVPVEVIEYIANCFDFSNNLFLDLFCHLLVSKKK